jgi:hypothetical protein
MTLGELIMKISHWWGSLTGCSGACNMEEGDGGGGGGF